MNIKRIVKHLLTSHWQTARAFPPSALAAIERSIKSAESAHIGEIRFAVEAALEPSLLLIGQSAAERAIDVFSQMRVWDTQHNNGLLIYVLLADRAVEIVADRGIHEKVGASEWLKVCHQMEATFSTSNFESGSVAGVQAVAQHLARHFPAQPDRTNELPDQVVVL
jgi:uncharacterized membrane protein